MYNREVSRWFFRLLLFFVSGFLLLELFFRFVMHADQRPASLRLDNGVVLFDTSYARDGHSTIGRFPLESFRWHINSQGWNSNVDYLAPSERDVPMIAIIGDSHVENLQSNVDQSIASYLQELVGESCLVYGFGKEDQSLIQDYMVMRYVDSLYSPDTFVLILGGDVIHRSIIPGPSMVYEYVVPSDSGFCIAPSAARETPGLAAAALNSALIRYLRFNARLDLFPLYRLEPGAVNLNRELSADQVDSLMPIVTDYILGMISEDFGERHVLLMLNIFITRYQIYQAKELWFSDGTLRIPKDFGLVEACSERLSGITCVDSYEAFSAEWENTGRRFESPDGKHLSSYGNRVLAEDIFRRLESSGVLARILNQ